MPVPRDGGQEPLVVHRGRPSRPRPSEGGSGGPSPTGPARGAGTTGEEGRRHEEGGRQAGRVRSERDRPACPRPRIASCRPGGGRARARQPATGEAQRGPTDHEPPGVRTADGQPRRPSPCRRADRPSPGRPRRSGRQRRTPGTPEPATGPACGASRDRSGRDHTSGDRTGTGGATARSGDGSGATTGPACRHHCPGPGPGRAGPGPGPDCTDRLRCAARTPVGADAPTHQFVRPSDPTASRRASALGYRKAHSSATRSRRSPATSGKRNAPRRLQRVRRTSRRFECRPAGRWRPSGWTRGRHFRRWVRLPSRRWIDRWLRRGASWGRARWWTRGSGWPRWSRRRAGAPQPAPATSPSS